MSWTRTLFALSPVVLAAVVIKAAEQPPPNTGMADAAALITAFDRFAGSADPNVLVLPLSNLRGLSNEPRNAGGSVRIDLATGVITSTLQLMPTEGTFELWLSDNQSGEGRTTLAEDGDVLKAVGTYVLVSGRHRLSVTLGPEAFTRFYPDRAFVIPSDNVPVESDSERVEGFLLTGSATFFARLRHRQVRFVDDPAATRGFDPSVQATRAADFARLAAQGRRAFLDETFNGNGRTCGTCHVEANNFTVDPELIATLPSSDPLFVAETNPALATLENPDLLRRFGLILVNADGFVPPAGGPPFVLRATQNVQALANSSAAPDASIDFTANGRNPNPAERLGWGNDGVPLRDFALVAIAQHAPKTMHRERGLDFRVPTDEELDALAAYQLGLGRQEDFDLPSLTLTSPVAMAGKALYLDTGRLGETGHKNCNACHFNGGGTAAMSFNPQIPGFPRLDGSPRGFNMTAETNVNELPLALSLGLPRDGGFGQLLTVFGSFGNTHDNPIVGHLELEGFNSPPVVESADTGPFFHNHTVADLESAVAFYGTPAFQASVFGTPPVIPVAISPDPDDPEVQAIAAFLRVLNALENIRSSINVAVRGRTMTTIDDMRDLARLARAEAVDAIEVLSGGALAKQRDAALLSARGHLLAAGVALESVQQPADRNAIDNLFRTAILQLRAARSSLADPATLPASFRK
jgi:cytochrome c peroxidase